MFEPLLPVLVGLLARRIEVGRDLKTDLQSCRLHGLEHQFFDHAIQIRAAQALARLTKVAHRLHQAGIPQDVLATAVAREHPSPALAAAHQPRQERGPLARRAAMVQVIALNLRLVGLVLLPSDAGGKTILDADHQIVCDAAAKNGAFDHGALVLEAIAIYLEVRRQDVEAGGLSEHVDLRGCAEAAGKPTPACHYQRLVREDAYLILVFVSHGDDCSVRLDLSLATDTEAAKEEQASFARCTPIAPATANATSTASASPTVAPSTSRQRSSLEARRHRNAAPLVAVTAPLPAVAPTPRTPSA